MWIRDRRNGVTLRPYLSYPMSHSRLTAVSEVVMS